MTPTVSVVIPCYNVASFLEQQLAALVPQLQAADEVVLVDNRSTDGSAELMARLEVKDPRIRRVPAMDRPGVNHARNIGLAHARNDVILICDADDRVHPGWVEAFRKALTEPGIAGGVAMPVDVSGRRVGPDIGLATIYGGPFYPIGCNMGMSRAVYEAVGGFDEAFVGGHDEVDFAWRAAEAGWETVLVEDARLDYLQRPTVTGAARQHRSYARTAIQLWARHADKVAPNSISFSGSIKRLLRSLPKGLRAMTGRGSLDDARAWGWTVGTVEGHLRYRLFGKPPSPLLAEGSQNLTPRPPTN